jgi:hypothetical protein
MESYKRIQLAAEAQVHTDTVEAYLRGRRCLALTKKRLLDAAKRLHILRELEAERDAAQAGEQQPA